MITGVVLARNEEHNIVDCLAALAPHVGELLLIDMESSDATVALAEPFGVTVLKHALVQQFDAARNIAIPVAHYDWLWFVDADERVSPAVGALVNRLVRERGEEFAAISIPFKTWFCGKWIEHCGWWPGFTMPRVLKRGTFRFASRLHGGVEVNGRELRLPAEPEWGIDHFSYPSLAAYVEKFNRYTAAEAELLAADDSRLDWRTGVRHMLRDLWLYYEANAGQRDGRQGWLLSWMAGQYRFMAHAKRWELAKNAGLPAAATADVPASLDEFFAVCQEELAACRRHATPAPRGLVLRTPLYDASGYAEEGRLFARALAVSGQRPRVENIPWSDQTCALPATEGALYRALEQTPRGALPIVITNCIPTLVAPDDTAAVNVLRTTFEIDCIPDDWLPRLAAFDEVWLISEHNRAAFRRSGVEPEKLRVVPSGIDTELFTPVGPARPLPERLAGRFVFLSVFDWQWRKGWDVLLRAYCAEFSPDDEVGLWLKITRAHGHALEEIERQIDAALAPLKISLADRPDVVLDDQLLEARAMPELYRAASAFVLATRGEGWGRPYMEAMACGLPVIGTAGSGNVDFMHGENSFLVPATLAPVPEMAAREIPPYRGGQWFEPEASALRRALRHVRSQREEAAAVGQRAAVEVAEKYNLARTAERLAGAIAAATAHLRPPRPPTAGPQQVRVRWEGELFAGHSFAKVNEEVVVRLTIDERLAISLGQTPGFVAPWKNRARAAQLAGYIERPLPNGAQVTVRHAFPPDWRRPATGKWVHIQPWEFGALPRDWVAPLVHEVDEIWAPSHYVRRVYERSGVPAEKIHVIAWGVDSDVHSPRVTPLLLPTVKRCRFLFVGGAIERKGFDTLLEAYVAEFRRDDDVCLVVKDLGQSTFYRDGRARERIAALQNDPLSPEILYFDQFLTEGQVASLYTACTCFAAPYRGEGFGLPILEALASGLPAVVPRGGPSDDYLTEEHAYLLAATESECDHPWRLCGPATEWNVSKGALRGALRRVYEQPGEARAKGAAAAEHVAQCFTWNNTVARMTERLVTLAAVEEKRPTNSVGAERAHVEQQIADGNGAAATITACVVVEHEEAALGAALASVRPYVDEIVCVAPARDARSAAIAGEYGARVYGVAEGISPLAAANMALRKSTCEWILWLPPYESCGERGLVNLREFLRGQQNEVEGAWAAIGAADGCTPWPGEMPELRVWRNRNNLDFTAPAPVAMAALMAAGGGQIVESALEFTALAMGLANRIAHWHEFLGSEHTDTAACFELGRLHFQLGNFFHAECYLHEYLAAAPPLAVLARTSLMLLIECYCRLDDPIRAEEQRRRFAELFPHAALRAMPSQELAHERVLGRR